MTDAAAKTGKLLRQQAALVAFGNFALRERSPEKILAEAARACAEGLGARFGLVRRYRAEQNDLVVVASHGWPDQAIDHAMSRVDMSSPQARAFITGEPSISGDLKNCGCCSLPAPYTARGIVSVIDVVIKGEAAEAYGVVEVADDQPRGYDKYDIKFLTDFAGILAEAVSAASRLAGLQSAVDRMTALVEERNRLLREHNAVEKQLRQTQKMEAVGQLTGGIAHDLNNILTVITGTIEILAEGVADRPELVAITRMIDEAGTRGAELTQRLLAFARKQPLRPREVDANALLTDTAGQLQSTLGGQVEVSLMLATDASRALVDPGQLTNAIHHLAFNARDAMADGGKLIIETSNVVLDDDEARINGDIAAGSYVMIAVTDSGHGIPAGILDNVFEPFFTTKDVGKGAGLGLSMVYGFVKQSNGHITMDSAEGRGTTVRIYLPQALGAIIEAAESVLPSGVEGRGETILVVEDDHLVRTFVVGQIQSLGYLTLAAVNAAEALDVINGPQQIDLLFTDMIMPGSMNGRQLADKALQRRASLKVLFTSGYSNGAIIHDGHLDAGVLLLAKPYRKSDLARMIRAALAV